MRVVLLLRTVLFFILFYFFNVLRCVQCISTVFYCCDLCVECYSN
jgi:hypothetical protein